VNIDLHPDGDPFAVAAVPEAQTMARLDKVVFIFNFLDNCAESRQSPSDEPATGARLGSHALVGILGASGMGEVYHARDTKLGRDVALKILPEAFACDAERVARFKR
jgi:hypothetical protein